MILRMRSIMCCLLVSMPCCWCRAQEPNSPENIRLLLPKAIYASPGVEMNIYFDNVTLVPDASDYVFDIRCDKGIQQQERWTWTPADGDAGSFPLTLTVRDGQNRIVALTECAIVVAPPDAGAGRAISALLIGDSLTKASVYSQRLLDLFTGERNPGLTLIGTNVRDPDHPENRHEGYGGWRAETFATRYTGAARDAAPAERSSPFLYKDGDAEPVLDFGRYCQDVNGGARPDFVTIFLGCNDVFGAEDENIEAAIDTVFANLALLINAIRAAAPETWIGLVPPVPPSATQDAFGVDYACGQTRWQYKRNQHRVAERMYARYGGRDPERIAIVPAFANLDCMHNYPAAQMPWNAHAEETAARQTNGVHPAPSGYRQIGDSIYCWIKAVLASQ